MRCHWKKRWRCLNSWSLRLLSYFRIPVLSICLSFSLRCLHLQKFRSSNFSILSAPVSAESSSGGGREILVQHLLVKENDLKLLVDIQQRISRGCFLHIFDLRISKLNYFFYLCISLINEKTNTNY